MVEPDAELLIFTGDLLVASQFVTIQCVDSYIVAKWSGRSARNMKHWSCKLASLAVGIL